MENKDKVLLLKDLCARLPYGVKCQIKGEEDFEPLKLKSFIQGEGFCAFDFDIKENLSLIFKDLDEFKPYLFPLSSMTEEQNKVLIKNYHFSFNSCSDGITNGIYSPTFNRTIYYSMNEDDVSKIIDWLNKNHFDYRGLIEKGLAIDATGLNIYKEEQK